MPKFLVTLLTSSIGRKFVMGLTGLGALAFLAGHLGGNLLYYLGPGPFNEYAKRLHDLPFLKVVEAKLALLFCVHIFFAVWLTLDNWRARPTRYALDAPAGGRDLASSSMIWSGLCVLAFMLLHVWGMKFGGASALPAFDKVTAILVAKGLALAYLLGTVALAFHLYHGGKSILQTFGLRHPAYDSWTDLAGRAAGLALAAGFASLPLFVLLTKGGVTK